MTSSLVGSEMCIRDRFFPLVAQVGSCKAIRVRELWVKKVAAWMARKGKVREVGKVGVHRMVFQHLILEPNMITQ
eukprot:9056857-Prorocentrum_lima.AAC.1